MRQIKEGMIACTCDEVINIIDVIDLFSQSTIKDIEHIINKEITLYWRPLELRLYINSLRAENEIPDEMICLEPAPTPFIIRKKEKPEFKGVEFLCFSWLKSRSSIEDLEELSPYTKFSKFFFLRDDIDKYVRKHKNISSKFTSDKPIEPSDLTACDSTERKTANSYTKDDELKEILRLWKELLNKDVYKKDYNYKIAINIKILKLEGYGSQKIVEKLNIAGQSKPAKILKKYEKFANELEKIHSIKHTDWWLKLKK